MGKFCLMVISTCVLVTYVKFIHTHTGGNDTEGDNRTSCATGIHAGGENLVDIAAHILHFRNGSLSDKVYAREGSANIGPAPAPANASDAVPTTAPPAAIDAAGATCADGCITTHYTYACCYTLPEVKYKVCANVTYLPENYGFNFTISVGDYVFWEEVSLKNPPPVCLEPKFLPHNLGELCISINDINVTSSRVHFCAKFIFELARHHIYEKELGCVNIPLAEVYAAIAV